jgi:flagellar biosynthetic protein FliR
MTNILITDFLIVFLIFLRILSAFIAAPVFGHKAIPTVSKIFISFVIAYIVFNTVDRPDIVIEMNIWWIATNAIKEIFTGVIMGYMLNFIFFGINFAGTLIGFDIGLAMATIFNPVDESSGNVIGQLIYFLGLLMFFIINGHHYVIQALSYSFHVIPLAEVTITGTVVDLLIKYSAGVFIIAVKIAAPILVSYFLIHIAEGILARIIPQMQVFFVTYPIKIGVGFLILLLLVPLYVNLVKNLLYDFEDKLLILVRAMGS